MPSQELKENFDPANLIGNVSVPRAVQPTLRAAKRRKDPDGSSAVPYIAGLSGKKLDLEYTDASLSVQTATITFSSNSYAQVIIDINAADPTDLEALDADGFLVIRNRNGGSTHYLRVTPHAAPVDEAADILGFVVFPYPGHVSYAGEVATSPGSRSQSNPQGTTLVARDEDLTAEVFNRGFYSALRAIDLLRSDFERDVLVPHEVSITFQTHPVSGSPGFFLDDPTLRIPIAGLFVTGITTIGTLDAYFDVTKLGSQLGEQIFNASLGKLQITRGHYSDGTLPLDTNNGFGAWGAPDGGVLHDAATIPTKAKHASVTISSIRGNVLYCPGATFSTLFVQKNDPIVISGATNSSPFDHNGVFAVLDVIDDEHISVRPLGTEEGGNWASPLDGQRPTELNATGSGFGDVTVYFGDFVPCSQMWFSTTFDPGVGFYSLRLMVGRPLRERIVQIPNLHGNASAIFKALDDHLNDSSNAHAASAIGGFTSAITWRDGAQISGATLQATVEDILTDLRANASGANSGARRVGAHAIGTGGNVNKALAQGDVHSQLLELLTFQRDHEIDENAHDVIGVVSGFDQGPYSFPNLPIAGGTLVAKYQNERRVFTASGTSFSLSGNQIYYIYLDFVDSTIKITQTQATAFSNTTYPLYYLFTQGFGITWIHDFRFPLASSYNRSKGTVTVGGNDFFNGCDFATLEAAVAWISLVRGGANVLTSSGIGSPRTWEILITTNITMLNTVGISFPITIRGAAKDSGGSPGCKVTTPLGIFSGQTHAFSAANGSNNVVIKDLYFVIPTGTPSFNSRFIGFDFGHDSGDNWLIDNCVFDGGTNAPVIEVDPNTATLRGWTIRNCWFKGAQRTSQTAYIKLLDVKEFLIKGCKFDGATGDALSQGIRFESTSFDNVVEDCWFDMGGRHIHVEDQCGVLIKNCRTRNARAASIYTVSTDEVVVDGCTLHGMTNSSVSEGLVWADANTGRLEVRNTRLAWTTGHAIRGIGNTSSNSRFVNNIFGTSSADRAIAGFDRALFMGNDFDMLANASSGNGQNVEIVLNVGNNNRVIGNFFRNCGSNASSNADTVIEVDNDCIVTGNHFLNCRGKMINLTANDNNVYGNVCEDCGTATTDIGCSDNGQRNRIFGNNFQNLSEASQLEIHPLFRLHQNWAQTLDQWTNSLNAGGSVMAVMNPAANKPGYWMRLRTTTTNDFAGKYSPSLLQGPIAADIAIVAEFYIDATAVAGTPAHYIQAGFCHDEGGFNGPTSTDDMVKLEKTSASANWRFKTGDTAGVVTTVTTSIPATGVQRIRIEVVGSSEPGGARAQLFIDGVLAASSTTNLPGDQVSPFAVTSVDQGSGGVQRDVFISPVTVEYRRIP